MVNLSIKVDKQIDADNCWIKLGTSTYSHNLSMLTEENFNINSYQYDNSKYKVK